MTRKPHELFHRYVESVCFVYMNLNKSIENYSPSATVSITKGMDAVKCSNEHRRQEAARKVIGVPKFQERVQLD